VVDSAKQIENQFHLINETSGTTPLVAMLQELISLQVRLRASNETELRAVGQAERICAAVRQLHRPNDLLASASAEKLPLNTPQPQEADSSVVPNLMSEIHVMLSKAQSRAIGLQLGVVATTLADVRVAFENSQQRSNGQNSTLSLVKSAVSAVRDAARVQVEKPLALPGMQRDISGVVGGIAKVLLSAKQDCESLRLLLNVHRIQRREAALAIARLATKARRSIELLLMPTFGWRGTAVGLGGEDVVEMETQAAIKFDAAQGALDDAMEVKHMAATMVSSARAALQASKATYLLFNANRSKRKAFAAQMLHKKRAATDELRQSQAAATAASAYVAEHDKALQKTIACLEAAGHVRPKPVSKELARRDIDAALAEQNSAVTAALSARSEAQSRAVAALKAARLRHDAELVEALHAASDADNFTSSVSALAMLQVDGSPRLECGKEVTVSSVAVQEAVNLALRRSLVVRMARVDTAGSAVGRATLEAERSQFASLKPQEGDSAAHAYEVSSRTFEAKRSVLEAAEKAVKSLQREKELASTALAKAQRGISGRLQSTELAGTSASAAAVAGSNLRLPGLGGAESKMLESRTAAFHRAQRGIALLLVAQLLAQANTATGVSFLAVEQRLGVQTTPEEGFTAAREQARALVDRVQAQVESIASAAATRTALQQAQQRAINAQLGTKYSLLGLQQTQFGELVELAELASRKGTRSFAEAKASLLKGATETLDVLEHTVNVVDSAKSLIKAQAVADRQDAASRSVLDEIAVLTGKTKANVIGANELLRFTASQTKLRATTAKLVSSAAKIVRSPKLKNTLARGIAVAVNGTKIVQAALEKRVELSMKGLESVTAILHAHDTNMESVKTLSTKALSLPPIEVHVASVNERMRNISSSLVALETALDAAEVTQSAIQAERKSNAKKSAETGLKVEKLKKALAGMSTQLAERSTRSSTGETKGEADAAAEEEKAAIVASEKTVAAREISDAAADAKAEEDARMRAVDKKVVKTDVTQLTRVDDSVLNWEPSPLNEVEDSLIKKKIVLNSKFAEQLVKASASRHIYAAGQSGSSKVAGPTAGIALSFIEDTESINAAAVRTSIGSTGAETGVTSNATGLLIHKLEPSAIDDFIDPTYGTLVGLSGLMTGGASGVEIVPPVVAHRSATLASLGAIRNKDTSRAAIFKAAVREYSTKAAFSRAKDSSALAVKLTAAARESARLISALAAAGVDENSPEVRAKIVLAAKQRQEAKLAQARAKLDANAARELQDSLSRLLKSANLLAVKALSAQEVATKLSVEAAKSEKVFASDQLEETTAALMSAQAGAASAAQASVFVPNSSPTGGEFPSSWRVRASSSEASFPLGPATLTDSPIGAANFSNLDVLGLANGTRSAEDISDADLVRTVTMTEAKIRVLERLSLSRAKVTAEAAKSLNEEMGETDESEASKAKLGELALVLNEKKKAWEQIDSELKAQREASTKLTMWIERRKALQHEKERLKQAESHATLANELSNMTMRGDNAVACMYANLGLLL